MAFMSVLFRGLKAMSAHGRAGRWALLVLRLSTYVHGKAGVPQNRTPPNITTAIEIKLSLTKGVLTELG